MRYVLLWLSFLTTLCLAKDPPPPPKPAELFAWYDRLGFEDVSKAKFARIWTGSYTVLDGVRQVQDISRGFVLEDHGETFRAVLADLTVATFKKAGTKSDEAEFCGYQEASLKDEAQQLLKDLENPKYFEHWENDNVYSYHDRLSRHAQVFVIARECARGDLTEVGTDIFNALAIHSTDDGSNRGHPFPDWLRYDFADAIERRARISFRDPNLTWSDIRAQFQLILDHCPDSYEVKSARTMIKDITALLAQEKKRKLGKPDDPKELVWKLHDEQNEKWEDDFWPRPYPFVPRKSNGAMAALRKSGNKAVPALLAELRRKPRVSRSGSISSRFGGGLSLQDTRELALDVLSDIAGFNCYWIAKSEPWKDRWVRITAAVEDWWAAVSAGKEREWLVKTVSIGGRKADAVGDCLLQRYPADFLESAISAVRNSVDSNDPYPRRQFIERLLKLKDPRVETSLAEEITKTPTLEARVQLASALRQLGRLEGEHRILEEFRRFSEADLKNADSSRPSMAFGTDGDESVLTAFDFLLESNSPEPLTYLVKLWHNLPFTMRVDCVERLSQRNLHEEVDSVKPPTPEAQTQIKALFLLGLEDTRPQHGATLTYYGGSVFEPRLCDLAADALRLHWPDAFVFNRFASELKREQQRIAILNAHFRNLGRPELPLPKIRPKVPAEKADLVTDVNWDERSESPEDPLRKELNSWIGKPVTGELLVDAITQFVRSPDRRKHKLQLTVHRDGDQTGISIRVRRSRPHGDGETVSATKFVSAGGEITLNATGAGNADTYTTSAEWEPLLRRANEALRSPPEKQYTIQVIIGSGENEG